MKRAFALAAGLFLAATAVTPSAAQEVTKWKSVGWWDIQFFEEYGGCAAVAEFQNNSFVFIGLDTGTGNLGLRIAVLNQNWSSITPDEPYQVVVRFDRRAPWNLTMYGADVQGRPGLYNLFPADSQSAANFVREFQRSRHMVWTFQGTELGDFSLKSTNQAYREVYACTDQYLKNMAGSDPFASGKTGASGGGGADPFK
ncbi:MAG: hypothetical protein ACRBCL_03055 [Maritimibacter sp.]